MLFPTKVGAIEFDLDHDDVRVAVVRVGRGLPALVEVQEVRAEYDHPDARFEALVTAVDRAVSALTTRPATFVLCTSTRFSVVRVITIPFRGRSKVAAAVPFELEPYLAFSIDELLVDFTVVDERSGQTDVLAVGSRRDQLDEQLAILEGAGVEAEAVGLDAAGLAALWVAAQKSPKGLNAGLHVRENGAILTVTRNKALVYFRHLTWTGDQIREKPTVFVRDVQNTLRGFLASWQGGGAIERLHVTGLSLEPEAKRALVEALRVPVEEEVLLGRLKGHEVAMDRDGYVAADNVWEAAIGVAMGAAGGRSAFDFKRFERSWQSAARGVITHLMFSACLGLIALMAWAYYCYHGAAENRAYAEKVREQIASVQAEIVALEAEGLPDVPPEIMRIYNDPPLLDILVEISTRMPAKEVTLTEIRLTAPGAGTSWLKVRGFAEEVGEFNKSYARLRQCSFMAFNRPPVITSESVVNFDVDIDRAAVEANNDGQN
jgi:hypothetical protein